tara:strand:+ start:379 stop:588 length:210 start_codon:yes stop_codon:yes gene_type:complete
MLDALGERYGLLPSEVLGKANTFDLNVYDITTKYHNKQQRKQAGTYDINEEYTQEELQSIMDKARGNKN